jgi:predicted phage-related endonuclease
MIEQLIQGTPEWEHFRLMNFGASEAAAMLGLSSKVTRNQLLYAKYTCTPQEFSSWVQENILDYGHEVEAMARPIVEEMIGQDLYPVTCSHGDMSASCDGLTMDEKIAFEHKQWNESLAESVASGVLPEEYQPQCQQIMIVTGAKKVIFVVSNGTRDKFVWMEVFPDHAWFDRIKTGWNQFAADLDNYQHVEILPAPVATPVMGLPALSIQVSGSIALKSNLDIFGERLKSFVDGIDKNPSDDQAFADAEAAIKVLEKAQEALEAAESSALAQTASIDDMRTAVKMYCDLARTNRLMLEKIVKARKETIRAEMIQAAKIQCNQHIATLNQRIGNNYMPIINADFAAAIKGKKTIESLKNAIDTELSVFKIEANAVADKIQFNLTTLKEFASDFMFLFADLSSIVTKANDDFTYLLKIRIADHKQAEEQRLAAERARIAEEERVKAEKKLKVEQQPIANPIPKAIKKEITSAKEVDQIDQVNAGHASPTEEEIVYVLASHYKVDMNTASAWLHEIFLQNK